MISCYWLSKQHNDTYAAAPFSNIRTTIVGGGGSQLLLSTWNGPSNTLQLNNSFWVYSTITPASITNVTGVDTNNNLATWATIVISNQGVGDLVTYSTVPFARAIGAQTHNPLAVPPGKVAVWSYLCIGQMSTNFVNSVQDAVSSAAGVSLVAAGTNIFIVTNSGLATISLADPTILNEVDVKNLYGSNAFFTTLTNAPFVMGDANGQLQLGVELPGTNVLLSAGNNVQFTTNGDGTIVIASTATNVINTITNNLLVTTNIIVYSNLTVLQSLYVSTNFSTNFYSTTAYITNLYTSIAYITNLYSSTAYITNLYTSIAYITNLYTSTAFITNLYSSTAFITNLYASTNFSTNLYFLNGNGSKLIITNNLQLLYLQANKLMSTDGQTNVTNASVSSKFTFTGNVLDLADLSTTYELHVAQLTNSVYGTNINYAPTTWAGPSNSIVLNNGYQTYVTTTPISITNWSLANNGQWSTMAISNNNGASITGWCTIPNIRFIGTQSTNGLVIPNGKVGIWSFLDIGLMSNCVNNVQQ